jgi:hypothetical protein
MSCSETLLTCWKVGPCFFAAMSELELESGSETSESYFESESESAESLWSSDDDELSRLLSLSPAAHDANRRGAWAGEPIHNCKLCDQAIFGVALLAGRPQSS